MDLMKLGYGVGFKLHVCFHMLIHVYMNCDKGVLNLYN